MASPAKSIVSQIRPRNRHFRRNITWGMDFRICNRFTLDLLFFARIREICHVGNVDILGLDIGSSGLNSVILRFRGIIQAPISGFWSLNIFTDTQQRIVWCSWQMSWIPKFALLGLSASWYQSDHCNDIIQETGFCFLESYLNKTITKPWSHPSNLSHVQSTAFLCLSVAAA